MHVSNAGLVVDLPFYETVTGHVSMGVSTVCTVVKVTTCALISYTTSRLGSWPSGYHFPVNPRAGLVPSGISCNSSMDLSAWILHGRLDGSLPVTSHFEASRGTVIPNVSWDSLVWNSNPCDSTRYVFLVILMGHS